MFIVALWSCLHSQKYDTIPEPKKHLLYSIAHPISKEVEKHYVRIAKKKEEEIKPWERFFIRSTFHHMTAVGDIIAPEASQIVRALTLMDIPPPDNPNRSVNNCKANRIPQKGDTIVPLPPRYFSRSLRINEKVRKLSIGIHRDAFSVHNSDPRMRFAYNPVCYEITKTQNGKKKVRAYVWMKWSRAPTTTTYLPLGPFAVNFPDSLIYIAGKATPYYAQTEWILP